MIGQIVSIGHTYFWQMMLRWKSQAIDCIRSAVCPLAKLLGCFSKCHVGGDSAIYYCLKKKKVKVLKKYFSFVCFSWFFLKTTYNWNYQHCSQFSVYIEWNKLATRELSSNSITAKTMKIYWHTFWKRQAKAGEYLFATTSSDLISIKRAH